MAAPASNGTSLRLYAASITQFLILCKCACGQAWVPMWEQVPLDHAILEVNGKITQLLLLGGSDKIEQMEPHDVMCYIE
jgi:hypothetical protein